jgi:hypothetical protein
VLTNETPFTDPSDNSTGCCPRFSPDGWHGQTLHFQSKPFVRAVTHSENYVPLDMGPIFAATFDAIEAARAADPTHALVLSRELSPSETEHLFAVTRDVPGADMVRLSGDFRTRVFEGSYADTPLWERAMTTGLADDGLMPDPLWFFFTTCPRCAEAYGKNYVVGVAQLRRRSPAAGSRDFARAMTDE